MSLTLTKPKFAKERGPAPKKMEIQEHMPTWRIENAQKKMFLDSLSTL
jgi:hypothetical protein